MNGWLDAGTEEINPWNGGGRAYRTVQLTTLLKECPYEAGFAPPPTPFPSPLPTARQKHLNLHSTVLPATR